MGNERREAMARMGKALIGGGAALGMIGAPKTRIESIATGDEYVLNPSGLIGGDPSWGGAQQNSIPYTREDPSYLARKKAAAPLRQQLEALEGYGNDGVSMTQFMQQTGGYVSHDLAAQRSTSPWFKAHVAHERAKKQRSAIRSLREEIEKIMRSPLETLESALQEQITAFLADVQKM